MPLLVVGEVLAAEQGEVSAVKAQSPAVDTDYRLGVADKVRVLVFREPTLSGEFIVGAEGALSLPLIGEVPAANRTGGQVRATIESRLADGYLRSPKVSLEVLSFRPFYILGEVNKPGEYPFSTGLTVMNAVATAGGFTYRADKKHVYKKGRAEAAEERSGLTGSTPVAPGDTIRIGQRYF